MPEPITPGSVWRREIAQRLSRHYAENPNVAAVIVGGSTARGHADRFSDIELGVFWHRAPTDGERREAIERAGADLVRLYPYEAEHDACFDDFTVGQGGILIEAVHYTTDAVERLLDAVLLEHLPDEWRQNVISGVQDGIVFQGAERIAAWQARAANYPQELAGAVVRRHATIDHFWRREMFLARGGNLMGLYQSFGEIHRKLLHILLALNRRYFFGFKWLDEIERRLPITPPDLVRRIQGAYRLPPEPGATSVIALVEETYDLLEKHLPEIDVAWLRRVFRYQRPLWDHAPFF